MKITKINIPNSNTSEQLNLLSPNYNSGSFINGYYWVEYLTNDDNNYYINNYKHNLDDDDIIYQIRILVRVNQIKHILNADI